MIIFCMFQLSILDQEGDNKSKRPRYDRNAPKPMPPKFSKTGQKDFEVFGFQSRQRRAYINLCMRYGLPPKDGFQERWILRELSRKSDKEFKAYTHTFMTHLCEPSSDGSDKFMDGVPKENLPRQGVLNRIGVMLLIQKKVDEFKKSEFLIFFVYISKTLMHKKIIDS